MKIFTAGHEVPGDATILNFKQVVNSFLQDNKDNGRVSAALTRLASVKLG